MLPEWKEDVLSEISERLLKGTSKACGAPALLVLEDGTVFRGTSCAAAGEVFGEICFNTAMGDYVDATTDLSYAGQILVMTYPQVGGYGVAKCDCPEQKPALRGLVVRDMCTTPSNWRSDVSFLEFLEQSGVVAIEGVDTRALVRHIRDNGAQRAVISTIDGSVESLLSKVRASEGVEGANLVKTVSCAEPRKLEPATDVASAYDFAVPAASEARYSVVVYDFGVRDGIVDNLLRLGCSVLIVPWDTPAERVLAENPTGVYLSDGPGDPKAVEGVAEQISQLLGKVPVFASGMGHELLALACGAVVEKLPEGIIARTSL